MLNSAFFAEFSIAQLDSYQLPKVILRTIHPLDLFLLLHHSKNTIENSAIRMFAAKKLLFFGMQALQWRRHLCEGKEEVSTSSQGYIR
jgi:hypothetical protein